jgi:ribosomal protein S18 acetylase RimI-like enzyme
MNVVLRDSDESDSSFLLELYCDTRRDEIAGWGWTAEQADAFLRMQHHARTLGYAAQHPEATDSIIMVDNEPVGRMLVDRSSEGVWLVDIALLKTWRGKGIGTDMVRELIESATTEKPVRLHVSTVNPARTLYERLGFVTVQENGGYFLMECSGERGSGPV